MMADIKLAIKIPEELYNYMMSKTYDEHLDRRFDWKIRFAVQEGIPLPNGCGRLIDADALENEFEMLEKVTNEESLVEKAEHKKLSECISIIKAAPTILANTEIEADKAEIEHDNIEAER